MPELRVRTSLPSAQGGVIDLISGHPLFARAWQGHGHKGVVVCLHGAESHSAWFSDVAAMLQNYHVDCFAYDRVGWGRSPGDMGELSSLHDIYDELCSLIYILREHYDRIHILGMSWGGLYALYAAKHLAPIVNSITAISPGIFLRHPFSRQSLNSSLKELFNTKRLKFNLAYSPEDFCSDPEQIRFVKNDPWRQTSVGPRFVGATLFMQSLIKSPLFKKPSDTLHVLLGDQDRMIHIQKTADFCEERDISFKTISGGHSLVLDHPGEVTKHLIKVDSDCIFQDPLDIKKAH